MSGSKQFLWIGALRRGTHSRRGRYNARLGVWFGETGERQAHWPEGWGKGGETGYRSGTLEKGSASNAGKWRRKWHWDMLGESFEG